MTRDDHNIWPSITAGDARRTRAWLAALGFVEGVCMESETGQVEHSEMYWPEGGRLMISSRGKADPTFEVPPGSTGCYVVTRDPDAVWARATELGATVVRPIEETDYGSRDFTVADAEGNRYSFGTYAGSDA